MQPPPRDEIINIMVNTQTKIQNKNTYNIFLGERRDGRTGVLGDAARRETPVFSMGDNSPHHGDFWGGGAVFVSGVLGPVGKTTTRQGRPRVRKK